MNKLFKHTTKLFFFMLVLIHFNANAQNRSISGTVYDKNGEPLIGAAIMVVGLNNTGTIADIDGNFEISLPEGSNLIEVSYVGFISKQVSIQSQSKIEVILEEDYEQLQEVVVIGYGQQERRDVIGAVGSIDAAALEQRVPTNALEAIQGRMAGVQIVTNSGAPGSSAQIRIRGTSTFGDGVNPLYIVDGQPVADIDNINPSDIMSIDVLKDGASAAIYGSRSANGVILVTTKNGVVGAPRLDIDYTRSYSHLTGKVSVPNTMQRLQYENLRDGNTLAGLDADSMNISYQNDTDWQDALTRIGIKDRVNLSFSGGSKDTKYYINMGYLDHRGIMINTSFKRFNTKFNIDFTPNDFFKAGTRVTLSSDNNQGVDEKDILTRAMVTKPYEPIYDFDGSILGRNPIALAQNEKQSTKNYRANLFQYFEIQPIKSLTFRATLGGNFRYRRYERFRPDFVSGSNPPIIEERNEIWSDWINEDYLTWKPSWGDNHNFQLVGGVAFQYWKNDKSEIESIGDIGTDLIETLNNATAFSTSQSGGSITDRSLASAFSRISYEFKGRYLISGTIRRDVSSRFGQNNRAGNFPAVAAGWRFSEEPFMGFTKGFLSNGKIRGNYAITGNDRIGDYASKSLYEPGAFYNGVNGLQFVQIENPDLSWESTQQWNVGLDLGFFNNRFEISAEYYNKITDNLIYKVPLNFELAVSESTQNVGSIENSGIELTISATPINSGKFRWTTNFNIATNENRVLELFGGNSFIEDIWLIEEGQPLGNFFGYKNLGIFPHDESNAFSDAGEQLTPVFDENNGFLYHTLNGDVYSGNVNRQKVGSTDSKGGDIFWQDLDNNYLIDEDDRQVIGNGQAGYFGGWNNDFSIGAFTLSVLLDYSLNNQIYRDFDSDRNLGKWWGTTASPEAIENSWKEQGDITEYPALNVNSRPANALLSNSYYVDDGSYIKLRTLRLNYNLPPKLYEAIKMRHATAFVTVNNVLTWTNYKGYDPEQVSSNNALRIGKDELQYPRQREYMIGVRFGF
ncbi:MAG: TonB-dependent receptor [Reichenbachiella sp.]|uniref:SusC/RagA family TonB-linked outer membrane protein n=1 Tax=Reichenbachiella sp. TaxID=2184521 RepID=UPI003297CF9A